MPWDVLSKLEFGDEFVGIVQTVILRGVSYSCIIDSYEKDRSGSKAANVLIDSSGLLHNEYEKWMSTYFFSYYRVVYLSDFTLCTVYSPGEGKGDKELKRLLERFEDSDFELVLRQRSLPMVLFLAKYLIGLRCEQKAKVRGGSFETSFDTRDEAFLKLSDYSFENIGYTYRPFFSIGRSYWVVFSFSEERAHRIAIDMESHCESGVVVFLNPSFDRHHRSRTQRISVLSLLEFCQQGQSSSLPYFRQVFLLQNFLNLPDGDVKKTDGGSSTFKRDPYDREVREALTMIRISPFDEDSFFYILACFNLLNAYITKNYKNNPKYKDAYFFKSRLPRFLADGAERGIPFQVNLEFNPALNSETLLICTKGYMFSFHGVSLDSTDRDSLQSVWNPSLTWCRVTLQPIAPRLLHEGRKALLARS